MATPTALPTAFVAGQILTATNQNLLRGAFRVLQVVSGSTTTTVINSTNVQADTNLTATITPQYNTSKVLVLIAQNGATKEAGSVSSGCSLFLYRDTTQISTIIIASGFNGISQVAIPGTLSTMFLDSPATTSAVTYKTKFANFANAASVKVQANLEQSTILLCEISA